MINQMYKGLGGLLMIMIGANMLFNWIGKNSQAILAGCAIVWLIIITWWVWKLFFRRRW